MTTPAPSSTPPDVENPGNPDAPQGTYCPRCGALATFDMSHCPSCGHAVFHHPSKIQRYCLLGGLGFIILGGILIFLQPKAYHTFAQDLFECMIVACVIGAGVCFFTAVADMVRRGGE